MRFLGQNLKFDKEFDKFELSVQSQIVILNMVVGETIKIANNYLLFKSLTKKRCSFVWVNKNENLYFDREFFEIYGYMIDNNNSKKTDKIAHLFREIEGDLIVDHINALNPFHELSDCGKVLMRDQEYENYNFIVCNGKS